MLQCLRLARPIPFRTAAAIPSNCIRFSIECSNCILNFTHIIIAPFVNWKFISKCHTSNNMITVSLCHSFYERTSNTKWQQHQKCHIPLFLIHLSLAHDLKMCTMHGKSIRLLPIVGKETLFLFASFHLLSPNFVVISGNCSKFEWILHSKLEIWTFLEIISKTIWKLILHQCVRAMCSDAHTFLLDLFVEWFWILDWWINQLNPNDYYYSFYSSIQLIVIIIRATNTEFEWQIA